MESLPRDELGAVRHRARCVGFARDILTDVPTIETADAVWLVRLIADGNAQAATCAPFPTGGLWNSSRSWKSRPQAGQLRRRKPSQAVRSATASAKIVRRIRHQPLGATIVLQLRPVSETVAIAPRPFPMQKGPTHPS